MVVMHKVIPTVASQDHGPSTVLDDVYERRPEVRVRLIENIHFLYEDHRLVYCGLCEIRVGHGLCFWRCIFLARRRWQRDEIDFIHLVIRVNTSTAACSCAPCLEECVHRLHFLG